MRAIRLLASLGVIAACVGLPPPVRGPDGSVVGGTRSEPTGCFDLELGEWNPALWRDIEYYEVPRAVELTADTADFPMLRGYLAVEPPLRGADRPQPGGWRRVGRDSVHVVWTSGYVGVRLELRVFQADSLAGRAVAFHDDLAGVTPRADVSLRRRRC